MGAEININPAFLVEATTNRFIRITQQNEWKRSVATKVETYNFASVLETVIYRMESKKLKVFTSDGLDGEKEAVFSRKLLIFFFIWHGCAGQ